MNPVARIFLEAKGRPQFKETFNIYNEILDPLPADIGSNRRQASVPTTGKHCLFI